MPPNARRRFEIVNAGDISGIAASGFKSRSFLVITVTRMQPRAQVASAVNVARTFYYYHQLETIGEWPRN